MNHIKEAFNKVKQNISNIQDEVNFLRKELIETRESVISICEIIKSLQLSQEKISLNLENIFKKKELQLQANNPAIPTNNPTQNSSKSAIPTNNPTQNLNKTEFITEKKIFSIGNGGVPADRQTDRQTDEDDEKLIKKELNSVDNAFQLLNSLDSLKREIRFKFKRLTPQEMLIFTTIYQIEEEGGISDYRTLSQRLNLTESSVRDYIGKLIKKEIPIEKNKIKNKTIVLSISKNLKRIVSLSTIFELRNI